MSRRVFFYVQHLLGIGHLQRAVAIAIASPQTALGLLPKYREEIVEALAALSPAVKALAVLVPLVATAAGLWGVRLVRASNRLAAPSVLIGMLFALSLFFDIAVVPAMNRFKTGKNFCEDAAPYLARSQEAFLFFNDLSGVYNLYTGRLSLPVLPDENALSLELGKPAAVAVIGEEDMFRKLAPEALKHCFIAAAHRVGHRNMLLLTNWDPKSPAASARP